MKILLCSKYEMKIEDSLLQVEGPHVPFFMHLHSPRRLAQLARFTWCWEKLIQQVKREVKTKPVQSVVEYFGGMGRSSVIIQEELRPKRHVVIDIDEKQYQHLNSLRSIYSSLFVYRDDAYGIAGGHPADFAALDFPYFTLTRLLKEAPFTKIIGAVTSKRPRYLEISDGALSRLHLNYAIYSEVAGTEVRTPEQYFQALSQTFLSKFNYGISFAAHFGRASALLLQPGYKNGIEIRDACNSPSSKTYLTIQE